MVGIFPGLRLIKQACIPFQKSLSSPPSLDTFYMKLYYPKLYILCAQVFFPEPSVNSPVSKAERKWSFLLRIILSSNSWPASLLHFLGWCWLFVLLLWKQTAVAHPLTGVLFHLSLFSLVTLTILTTPYCLLMSQISLPLLSFFLYYD